MLKMNLDTLDVEEEHVFPVHAPTIVRENFPEENPQPILPPNHPRNPYNYAIQNEIKFHYGNGAKNMLKSENKLYNFKFYHHIEILDRTKQVSAGFNTIEEFTNTINPLYGYYYIFEYIFNDKLCMPYFDYDLMLNEKPSEEYRINKIKWIVINIQRLFYQEYNIDFSLDEIVFADSSGFKDEGYKFSLHIIINSNYVFKNNKDCSYIFQELHKLDKGFDSSVYSTDRLMRSPMSAKSFKDKRVMRILDKNYHPMNIDMKDFEKYLITNVPENYKIIPVKIIERRALIHKTIKDKDQKKAVKIPVIPTDAKMEKIVTMIQNKFHEDTYFTKYTFTDQETGYHMYGFNYTDHTTKCFTGHQHDQIGFYCYIDNKCNVIVKCFSTNCKDCKYVVGNLNQDHLNNDYIKIHQKRLLPDNCSLTEKDDKMVQKLIKLKKHLKSLCYWSAMGSGKSYLMEYDVKRFGFKRVLIISTRQSYANNMIENFIALDFVNYLDDKQWIKKDRMIVQLESLTKILRNLVVEPFDLIILDECESILYQFASSTIAESSRDTFQLLHTLCSLEQTKVLALDADWGERSEKFIKSLGSYEVIQNTYQASDRHIQLTPNYDYYNEKVFDSINKGENVCLVILSTKEIAYYKKKLKAMGIKFIIHTRDTDDELKRLLKTVNDLWILYQVVIYSPAVSVGVDFCVKHFHKIFAYIVPNTASPRMFLQMLGRVRDVKDHSILTYYNNLSTRTDQFIYNYDDVFDYYKFAATDSFLNKNLQIDEHGNLYNINKIGLYEEIMIHNRVEDLNKCSEYFITSLNLFCMYKSYKLQFLNHGKPTKREGNDDDYKEMIVNSPDIDQKTYDKILNKITMNNANEAEKFSVQKFKIKKFWDVDDVTIEFLQTYFRKEKVLINLRYLLERDLGQDSNEYIDNNTEKKCEVINEIIKVLGFDLDDLGIVIGMKEFYENGTILVSDSHFSKKYDKIRILFAQSKKVLDPELTGGNLIKMINGYLKDFGLTIQCINPDKKIMDDNGKFVRNSIYKLIISNLIFPFI